MPALTLSELQQQIAEYARARRERDLPPGALLALSLLIVGAALVGLSTISGVPRRACFAAVSVGMALLACTGLYVIATTRRFHQTHAPRCPHCDAALPHLAKSGLILDLLRDLEETVKVRPDLFETWSSSASEKLSGAARLRCPHCNGIVAAPAV